ncbi:hypothetical protein [Streptomyces cathayae]|uniref:Uncharacterized protein n=1 Tax=Streptomyces cathayae TaxID=3031124 RepID=A0ABY8K182_9ACTN|nr:hypothetical protein [Streptomyces sp. HUAS 5]WGD42000.1 hypothetical protein PYS65_18555 [Streptomyces sp. HUAS 5]
MFNRIRRTASRISARHPRKGWHRRPAPPARPLAASPVLAPGAPLFPSHGRHHTGVLIGEETALVRPYVPASEARARHRSTAAPCPPFAGPWCVPAGDR